MRTHKIMSCIDKLMKLMSEKSTKSSNSMVCTIAISIYIAQFCNAMRVDNAHQFEMRSHLVVSALALASMDCARNDTTNYEFTMIWQYLGKPKPAYLIAGK